jgi:hypothetical protein
VTGLGRTKLMAWFSPLSLLGPPAWACTPFNILLFIVFLSISYYLLFWTKFESNL